jgi:hypothetical protein
MAFEFKKFLTENRLTTISKLTLLKEEEEDEIQDEPTSKDIKPSKSTDDLAKKQYQLASLLKRKDELVSKFKSNEITIDQYKQMIGNIPQHIKTLSADIERLESESSESSELSEINEKLNEALNKDIKAFGQDLDKRFKDAGFDTLVIMQPATPEQLNIIKTNPKAVLFEVSQTPETQMLVLRVNPKMISKAESIVNKFQFSSYSGPVLKRGWTAKQVQGALNPGDIFKQDNDKSKGLWYFYRLAKVSTTVKNVTEASYEVLERIEGLVNQKDLQRFKESIQYISDDLEDEGFDGSEIKAFLQREFDEMLGMWK